VLDPPVREFLDALAASNPPPLEDVPLDELRGRGMTIFDLFGGPPDPVAAVEDRHTDAGVPVRVYRPEGEGPFPLVMAFHGGGFVIGTLDEHDPIARSLCRAAGVVVVSVDYRLAPEHPYPAGLDDCVAAARWLGTHGRELGIDPDRLLIGGDSAGGNLSAATILRLSAERAAIRFRAALLIYGRFSGDETESMKAWGDRDLVLSARVMEWFERHYAGEHPDRTDPYYAPLAGDLRAFPPSILVVGTLDPLLDDSRLFAAALEKAGVPVELHVYNDGLHAFLQFSMLDMCGDAIARVCAFARRAL